MAKPKIAKQKTPTCEECAVCCTYLNIVADSPTDQEDVNTLLWYIYHDSAELYLDEDGDWSIVFFNRCKQLGKNNLCKVYERRPLVCRQFSQKNCHGTDFDESIRIHFDKDEKLIKYFKKKRPGLFKKLNRNIRALAAN